MLLVYVYVLFPDAVVEVGVGGIHTRSSSKEMNSTLRTFFLIGAVTGSRAAGFDTATAMVTFLCYIVLYFFTRSK